MEIQIIIDNIDKVPDNTIVLIDGNLYGRYTHLLNEINILRTGETSHWNSSMRCRSSTRICEKRGIMLVGVSKFSKTRVLTAALTETWLSSMSDQSTSISNSVQVETR